MKIKKILKKLESKLEVPIRRKLKKKQLKKLNKQGIYDAGTSRFDRDVGIKHNLRN